VAQQHPASTPPTPPLHASAAALLPPRVAPASSLHMVEPLHPQPCPASGDETELPTFEQPEQPLTIAPEGKFAEVATARINNYLCFLPVCAII